MRAPSNPLLGFLTSLQVTVVLLVVSMILVFVATLDQVNLGIWAVQEKYFRSFLVFYTAPGGGFSFPIFPGGYLIGGLLLLNLLAVHIWRFSLSWKRLGIILSHVGVVVLLLGELVTGMLQEEYQLRFAKGETKSYAESFRDHELAIVDTSPVGHDEVVAIPEAKLSRGASLQHHTLPFRVLIKDYYPNSLLSMRTSSDAAATNPSNAGLGPRLSVRPLPITHRPNEVNLPAAFVELIAPEGSLGTFLVSPQLTMPQTIEAAGRRFVISLRLERVQFPYSLTLLDFRHDLYAGSDIPRNFSSRVRLLTADGSEDREAQISMNNPLRHGGMTFYQYQMSEAGGFSVLQVVNNPGWFFPYLASTLLFSGLLLHFLISLGSFLARRAAATAPSNP